MKKHYKIFVLLLTLTMILPGIIQLTLANENQDKNVVRLGGTNREHTAVLASQEVYNKSDVVVLAGYNGDVDALTGTLLASTYDAPLLITSKSKLSKLTEDEIIRLETKTVYILGGEAVVSTNVENRIRALNIQVIRLQGSNRFATAAKVAETIKVNKAEHVFVTLGVANENDAIADALAIGPVSSLKNSPVLLSETNRLPQETVDTLINLNVDSVTIIGGPAVVSPEVEQQLKDIVQTVDRVYGDNREKTAIAIANQYYDNAQEVIVANGRKSADALVGGYLGRKINGPILLTNNTNISQDTLDYISNSIGFTYVLGGQVVVSDNVFNEVSENINNVTNQYTVSFDSDGGEKVENQTLRHNRVIKSIKSPTKENHKFLGWDPSTNDSITTNKTFKALYQGTKFNVVFQDRNGKFISQQTVEFGKDAVNPKPPKELGYKFMGWDKSLENIKSDLVIKAKQEYKEHTVEILTGAGTYLQPHKRHKLIKKVKHGDDILKHIPAKTQVAKTFKFDGWDHDFKNITEDTIIKPVFIEDSQAISFTFNRLDKNKDIVEVTIRGYAIDGDGKRLLSQVNEHRAKKPTGLLTVSQRLNEAAMIRSAQTSIKQHDAVSSDVSWHSQPDGRAWNDVNKYTKKYANGENIAITYSFETEAAFKFWKGSAGHNDNMLRDNFITYGSAGFEPERGSNTWSQLFSRTESRIIDNY